MSDNWVVQNLQNTLGTWNEKLAEIWTLLMLFENGNVIGIKSTKLLNLDQYENIM